MVTIAASIRAMVPHHQSSPPCLYSCLIASYRSQFHSRRKSPLHCSSYCRNRWDFLHRQPPCKSGSADPPRDRFFLPISPLASRSSCLPPSPSFPCETTGATSTSFGHRPLPWRPRSGPLRHAPAAPRAGRRHAASPAVGSACRRTRERPTVMLW